jgi:ribosomal protein S25
MNEQTKQLRRVSNAIATHVIEFIDKHEGREFSNAELHSYVAERSPIAPGSADRILRDLKAKGAVRYELRNRAKSLYYVPVVGQRSLF